MYRVVRTQVATAPGLVGALDCATEEIAGAGAGSESPAPAMPAVKAEARAAVASDEADTKPPPPRVVRQLIVPKPVLVRVAPGTVSYVPNGAGGLEAPEDLTEAAIAALTPMTAARSAKLPTFQGTLSLEAQDDLIRGMRRCRS